MIQVKYQNQKYLIKINKVSFTLTTSEFHELVYQSLRAQEQEILSLMKLTEKNLDEIGDVTQLWKD